MQQEPKKSLLMQDAGELKGKRAQAKANQRVGKGLALLVAVAVIAVTGFVVFFSGWLDAPAPEESPVPTAVPMTRLFDSVVGKIEKITITRRESAAYTLLHAQSAGLEEPLYTVFGLPYFTLDQAKVKTLESAAMRGEGAIVAEDAEDLAIYGLENPALVLQVDALDGALEAIAIGDRIPTGGGYYARRMGEKNVYSVATSMRDALDQPLDSLHALALPVRFFQEDVARLWIEQAGMDTVELEMPLPEEWEKSISGATCLLVQPTRYDAHHERGLELIADALALTPDRYVGHAEAPEALEAYGLQSPRLRVRLTSQEGATLEIAAGNAEGPETYITLDESGDVYAVQSTKLVFAQNATFSRLVSQFANLVNIVKVDKMTIFGGGGVTFDLDIQRNEGGAGQKDSYFFCGQPTSEDGAKKLYQVIIGTLVDRALEDPAFDGEVVARVDYQLNSGLGDMTVEYLAYDGDYYAVRRDGKALFLIKHGKIDRMLEACQAYQNGAFDLKDYQ